jgi:uncharacterized membrane protein
VLLFWLSLTPSLLPLGPVFQGVVSALCALIGYGVGALAGWMLRSSGVHLRGTRRKRTWQVVAAVAATGTVVMLWLGHRWDDELRDLVGVERDSFGADLLMLLVAGLLFAVLLAVSRALKAAAGWVARQVGRVLPERVALVAGALVIAWVAWGLVTGVIGDRAVTSLDATFKVINDEFRTELAVPTSPYVSAGPQSGEAWDDLGRQGRIFVAAAPTEDQIAEFTDGAAQAPVRAYVGAPDGIELRDTAQRAVDELNRMGGFDRAVLNVVTGTGRGWVNENQARALEFMWAGDTATVSMQYSYLPSWMSFLVDQAKARDAGRALFDAVYGRWAQLPDDDRPELYVFGESLGTFGGEAAFSGLADIENRTDGVLWAGPPNFNELWRGLVQDRDEASPEWLPVYEDGRTVRFADEAADLDQPGGAWADPRVVYLQNGSDPIVWWSPRLILSQPDWLRGEPAPDVSEDMAWLPFVTFWQVTADLVFSTGVPDGHGHKYEADYADGWARVAQPPGWTDADTQRLRELIGGS